VDLRLAAAEADAVLVVTSCRGRAPSLAHNAIDWLTRRRRHGALHDKPLAVVGPSAGRYCGVWSRQIEDIRKALESGMIGPLAVPTLRDAVERLAEEVHGGGAGRGPMSRTSSIG
jgi:NAD(P)H-dependent FMN reductase